MFLPPRQLQVLQQVASELGMRMLGMEIVAWKELGMRAVLALAPQVLQQGQHLTPLTGQRLAQLALPLVSCRTSTSLCPGNRDQLVWSRYSHACNAVPVEGYHCTQQFKGGYACTINMLAVQTEGTVCTFQFKLVGACTLPFKVKSTKLVGACTLPFKVKSTKLVGACTLPFKVKSTKLVGACTLPFKLKSTHSLNSSGWGVALELLNGEGTVLFCS